MTHTFVLASIVTGAAALAAQQPPAGQSQSTAPRANQQVTVTGCVAAGQNNTFTLTAAPLEAKNAEAPTGTTATTPAGTKVTKTITYTLAGGNPNDLKAHVGHTVQVTGVEAAPQVSTTVKESSAGTSGTSGAAKPTVQTTSQAQLVTRQLTVSSVKMVNEKCDLMK